MSDFRYFTNPVAHSTRRLFRTFGFYVSSWSAVRKAWRPAHRKAGQLKGEELTVEQARAACPEAFR